MPVQRSTNFSDLQNVYIGLDVHLKQWNVCIYQGCICRKPFQQSPDVAALCAHLRRHYPDKRYYSAYEAGVCGCSIHYALEAAGIHNIIFNAADVSQTDKERKRKTDAMDAAKIARSLSEGKLECIHIPPQWRLADRNLLRLRSARIADLKRDKARLRHYLHVNGIKLPPEYGAGHWPAAFIQWLRQTACAEHTLTGKTLAMMTEHISEAMNELKNIDGQLTELMKTKRYSSDYALLRSVPGVGNISAINLLLECGDLSSFSSAESFCAFVGLIPDLDKSDEHEVRCGMTRRRHRVLRYLLTECAWRAIHDDRHLSSLYARYTCRMPPTKAIVKIANKLAKIIKFVLKNKKAYVQPQ